MAGNSMMAVRPKIPWMAGLPAPDVVLNLISCTCRRTCRPSDCSCILNGLKCTVVCKLQGCSTWCRMMLSWLRMPMTLMATLMINVRRAVKLSAQTYVWRCSVPDFLASLVSIAQRLGEVHAMSIVHNDIKSNKSRFPYLQVPLRGDTLAVHRVGSRAPPLPPMVAQNFFNASQKVNARPLQDQFIKRKETHGQSGCHLLCSSVSSRTEATMTKTQVDRELEQMTEQETLTSVGVNEWRV
ncbi:hypothetical protein GWK47_030252 [Chionoecetes opilio]|uniref:Uncharacterized protein n=1 Tax=Chionoecetes opilio TaxID=41210 RepID=A0A8J4YXI7_CHIOP|nr:hypothetical protein GWK47_030252 [Chionoecetes opilio]